MRTGTLGLYPSGTHADSCDDDTLASVGSAPSSRSDAVHRLCTSCDAEPEALAAGADDGLCPLCGAKLIEVRPTHDDMIGQVVDGRFELRARLGQGGMGTVYRAWQRSIGREVAVKLIDEAQARDVAMARRFLREARLTSQLSHPGTVSIYDFGQCGDGRLFIAMELVRGRTLDAVMLDDGVLTVERAVRIALQVCDALIAAHGLGVVHRDLKLENIMVLDEPAADDRVKVLDFGIAKSLVEETSHSTRTGLVVGTPRYMAPELAMGSATTTLCDLYALGVVLAELVTGTLLWTADGFAALVAAKLTRSPVLDQVPASLRPLVERLVAADPARRPATALAVREELAAIVDAGGARGAEREGRPPRSASAELALAGTVVADSATRRTVSPAALRPATPPAAWRAPPSAVTSPLTPASSGPKVHFARLPGDEPRTAGGRLIADRAPRATDGTTGTDAATSADGASLTAHGPRTLATTPAPRAPATGTLAAGGTTAAELPARRGPARWIVAVIGATAVVGVVALLLLRRSDATRAADDGDDPVRGAASAMAADPAPSEPKPVVEAPAPDAAPPTVQLSVTSLPVGAAVTIDGTPAGVTPLHVELAGTRAPVVLELRHPGHVTTRRELILDHDHTLELELASEPTRRRRPRAKTPPTEDKEEVPF